MTYKGQIPRARILTTFFVTLLIMNPIHGYMFLKPVQVGLGRCLDDNFVPHMVGDTWYDDKKCEMLTCMYIEGLLYISGYGLKRKQLLNSIYCQTSGNCHQIVGFDYY
ncbi:uncharacterized protein LOC143245052 isoform X2 [Tachypleus tridentatus]|uniref:uncharacterized protein LOC143245052 isoform X2 n=1 Tax=Tachypleus tridentatus TaxID=6853 RepID=UPI003FD569E9